VSALDRAARRLGIVSRSAGALVDNGQRRQNVRSEAHHRHIHAVGDRRRRGTSAARDGMSVALLPSRRLDTRETRLEEEAMLTSDVMTPHPRTLFLDDSIGEAWRALDELTVRHLPIVNASEEIVGMLSDRDLVRTSRDSDHTVATLMSGHVVSVSPDTPLDLTIDRIVQSHVGALPVVDDHEHVVGIVSYVDVLRAIPSLLEERMAHLRRAW
jgi:CBS-domain-containing membrane protein